MINFISILFTLFVLFSPKVFSQRNITKNFSEIPKAQYQKCKKIKYLTINHSIKKHSGKLAIPIDGKSSRIFRDVKEDNQFEEYKYLGDMFENFFLVSKTEYNSEEFYIINKTNGSLDTLIGLPVFSNNLIDFACINNAGTDETQKIQICQLSDGIVKTKFFLNAREHFLESIECVSKDYLFAKDTNGKYWKITFKKL